MLVWKDEHLQAGKTWYIDYYDQYGKRHREAVGPNKRLENRFLLREKHRLPKIGFWMSKKAKSKV